jgi:hypothetical protein
MPNKDTYYDLVVRALLKAGWSIVLEQYRITGARLFIDLKVQQQDQHALLIEIKSLEDSPIHELMELVGQYLVDIIRNRVS